MVSSRDSERGAVPAIGREAVADDCMMLMKVDRNASHAIPQPASAMREHGVWGRNPHFPMLGVRQQCCRTYPSTLLADAGRNMVTEAGCCKAASRDRRWALAALPAAQPSAHPSARISVIFKGFAEKVNFTGSSRVMNGTERSKRDMCGHLLI